MLSVSSAGGRNYSKFLNRLFSASAYITGGRIAFLLLNYGAVALLARYLGLRELGIYFMLTEVGRIGSIFCQAGTSQSTQKFLGRMIYVEPSFLPIVQRRMLLLLLATTAITIALCASLWGIVAGEFAAVDKIGGFAFFGCVMIVVTTFNAYQSSVLRAANSMLKTVLSMGLMQKAGFLILVIWLIFGSSAHITLDLALWSWTAAGALSILVGAYFVHSEMKKMRKVVGPEASTEKVVLPGYKELFLTSLPMGVSSGMATLRNSADVLIAGAVLGPAAAGIYGPCRMLSLLVVFVLQAVRQALPATVASSWRTLPLKQVEALVRKAANYGAIVAVPIALILITAGGMILGAAFGSKLAGYGTLIAVLVAGPLLSALIGSPGSALQMLGRQKLQMYVIAVVTVLSVILMPFIAKMYGLLAMGAVATSVVAVQNTALCYFAYKRLGIRSYVDPRALVGTIRDE